MVSVFRLQNKPSTVSLNNMRHSAVIISALAMLASPALALPTGSEILARDTAKQYLHVTSDVLDKRDPEAAKQ